MSQLGWHSFPGDNLPPIVEEKNNWRNVSINVLVKSSDGSVCLGCLHIYPKDDYFDEEMTWYEFGPDGYPINDVVGWAYAVPSLIPIQ